jgi:hypothetical protein
VTQKKPNPARGGAAGSGNAVCFEGEHLPDSAPAQTNQAKILRLVRPQRPRRIEVMIAARDGPAPIGRTRPLRLTEHDLERLIEMALRLEALR